MLKWHHHVKSLCNEPTYPGDCAFLMILLRQCAPVGTTWSKTGVGVCNDFVLRFVRTSNSSIALGARHKRYPSLDQPCRSGARGHLNCRILPIRIRLQREIQRLQVGTNACHSVLRMYAFADSATCCSCAWLAGAVTSEAQGGDGL
eukprot:2492237-Amphidinium_carterae.1